jgi:long-chain acyl-CoA synthetase
MKNVKRLFDLLPYYQKNFGDKNVLNAKVNGTWQPLSISELETQSTQMALAFKAMGISSNDGTPESKDKISIISSNRPEWIITDFATQKIGAVLVPIYPSISKLELEYILNEAETKILFIENERQYRELKELLPRLTFLKTIYSYDRIEGVPHWSELVQEPLTENGKQLIDSEKSRIVDTDVATIIYTSGTTGNPKGAMLTHKNILSNVLNSFPRFSMCDSSSNVLSFLPLNHIMERMVTYLYMFKGVSIFYAEAMETIGDNLREVKPAVFCTVPRLLEKVYEKIEKKGAELSGIKRKLFDWAVDLAMKLDVQDKGSLLFRAQLAIADKLIYSKWRQAVGGNVKAIVTGSAACQVKLLRIFSAAKLIVMEGYGLTESSPVISVNTYEKHGRKVGSVGTLIDNVEIKLAEDGEILFKGDNVMVGYYKNTEATKEVLIDGWLHTGDIGEYDKDGFLKITDRKKELFKLSSGKYIAPLPLETKIKESPYIEQIMVVGTNEKSVGALIVPSIQNIKEYFQQGGSKLSETLDFSQNADVLKLIRTELNKYNQQFAEHEHVKRFKLINQEWTIEGGELTPTLKLKRRKIVEKYSDLLAMIYNN